MRMDIRRYKRPEDSETKWSELLVHVADTELEAYTK